MPQKQRAIRIAVIEVGFAVGIRSSLSLGGFDEEGVGVKRSDGAVDAAGQDFFGSLKKHLDLLIALKVESTMFYVFSVIGDD